MHRNYKKKEKHSIDTGHLFETALKLLMTFDLKNVRAIRDKWMEMHGFQFYELRRIRESQSYRRSNETHGYRPSRLNGLKIYE